MGRGQSRRSLPRFATVPVPVDGPGKDDLSKEKKSKKDDVENGMDEGSEVLKNRNQKVKKLGLN